jgi:hypothetical protein
MIHTRQIFYFFELAEKLHDIYIPGVGNQLLLPGHYLLLITSNKKLETLQRQKSEFSSSTRKIKGFIDFFLSLPVSFCDWYRVDDFVEQSEILKRVYTEGGMEVFPLHKKTSNRLLFFPLGRVKIEKLLPKSLQQ